VYGSVNIADKTQLAPEEADQPENQAEAGAQNNAGRNRKVKRGVFAFVNNVAGQSAQPKWQFAAEKKESAYKNQQSSGNQESPAKFAESFHGAQCKFIVSGKQTADPAAIPGSC
jgi:hypothetical protein